MKRTFLLLASLLIIIASLVSCAPTADTSVWDTATYTADTTVGEGAKTVTVSVEAEDKTVILTVNTDADNLGEALYSLELINDPAFFDTIIGMQLVWEETQAYWCLYVGDSTAPVAYGVGDATINGGESFRIVYTK